MMDNLVKKIGILLLDSSDTKWNIYCTFKNNVPF